MKKTSTVSKKKKTSEPKFPTDLLVVSDHSAFQFQGVNIKGVDMISIRKMYSTKSDPTWRPSRSGLTVPLEAAKTFGIRLRMMREIGEEAGEFPILTFGEGKGE